MQENNSPKQEAGANSYDAILHSLQESRTRLKEAIRSYPFEGEDSNAEVILSPERIRQVRNFIEGLVIYSESAASNTYDAHMAEFGKEQMKMCRDALVLLEKLA